MENRLYKHLKTYFDLMQDSMSNAGFGYYQTISTDSKNVLRQQMINTLLLREMAILTELFQKAKIPHVFLKGPLLGHILYKNDGFLPSMRHTEDIDILVPLSFMPSVFNILGEYGYQYGGKRVSEKDCSDYIQSNQNGLFHCVHFPDMIRRHITLDLHFTSHKISPEISADDYQAIAEEQCSRAENIEIAGSNYPYLCTIDLLLSLCSHFAKHLLTAIQYVACESQDITYPMPLMRLVDIDLLLSHNQKDIENSLPEIIIAAKRQHCVYPFAFCVSLIYPLVKWCANCSKLTFWQKC